MDKVLKLSLLLFIAIITAIIALGYVGFSTPYAVEETASKSVVKVEGPDGVGTGALIESDLVITACHVTSGYNDVSVLYNSSEYTGQVVGIDAKTDLSIVRLERSTNFKGIEIADTIKENETVYSYPYNGKNSSEVNSVTRDASNYIKMDDPNTDINYFMGISGEVVPGFSGGPTFNTKGQLAGIQFLKIDNSRTGEHKISIITTADAINEVKFDLINYGNYANDDRYLDSDFTLPCQE